MSFGPGLLWGITWTNNLCKTTTRDWVPLVWDAFPKTHTLTHSHILVIFFKASSIILMYTQGQKLLLEGDRVFCKDNWHIHNTNTSISFLCFTKWGCLQSVGLLNIKWCSRQHYLLLLFSCFSHVWLFVTPWTVARQAPLSTGFPRQVTISFSRGSSLSRDQTHVSYIGRLIFYHRATRETDNSM